ncbi:ABC transporter ATP-binding protein [Halocalculus aciditolerans]|uniref:Nickel import system ATP-binding protein NikD n=1 Tax=Halocalculus aciditolerans TaxID=1383812 RepID=A0A830FCK0_9EURY|nr:ABC transporter ATP-binding protein [Halocalculus aciditolerans]GGL61189.1 hypothetical protein GCM10009039_19200 [Halocalculus aciditolerans]
MTAQHLLEVDGLRTEFYTERGVVTANDGVDLTIDRGEIVGLVGESGSGKSVLAQALMGIVEDPGVIPDGEVKFRSTATVRELAERFPNAVADADDPDADDPDAFVVVEERDASGEIAAGYVDLAHASDAALQHVRGSDIAMVFQDPMNSLNPTLTVGEQIAETVRLHQDVGESVSLGAEFKRKLFGAAKNSQAWRRAVEMLEAVSIPEPERRAEEFPHEFSGGMRQRAMIAMALSCEPDLLVADEPTTALDVTIQAQILDELEDLKDVFDTAILMITHDLAVVAETCDRVNVMYAGEIVERASASELFGNPQHPYTQGLIASTPRMSDPDAEVEPIPGNVPDLVDIPYACHFAPRCPEATRECYEIEPDFRDVGRTEGHVAACLRRGDDADAHLEGTREVAETDGGRVIDADFGGDAQ